MPCTGRILLLAVLVCLGIVAAAAPTLDEVVARLGEPAVVRGEFTQSRELEFLTRPLLSHGNFVLSGRGLIWQQLSAPETVVVADGRRLVQIVGDREPEVIDESTNPMTVPFSRIFLGLFRGDRTVLREQFDTDFDAGDGTWRLRLVPKDEPLSLAIDCIVLRGRQYIDELTIASRSGERTVIRFTGFATEPERLTDDEIKLYAR